MERSIWFIRTILIVTVAFLIYWGDQLSRFRPGAPTQRHSHLFELNQKGHISNSYVSEIDISVLNCSILLAAIMAVILIAAELGRAFSKMSKRNKKSA